MSIYQDLGIYTIYLLSQLHAPLFFFSIVGAVLFVISLLGGVSLAEDEKSFRTLMKINFIALLFTLSCVFADAFLPDKEDVSLEAAYSVSKIKDKDPQQALIFTQALQQLNPHTRN